jgi:hypothetical protein
MLLFVLAAATGQNPEPVVVPAGSATIAELKGEVVFHSPQGEVITPAQGAALAVESTIETTKGSVLLTLQDGSQVLVKGSSHVVLKSPTGEKGYWLELLLGKINAKVQKRLGNAPSFRMGTPTAVITVRGTRFSVTVNKKEKTSVEVYEGLVEVSGMHFGQMGAPVLLRPGFSTGVDMNRDPEAPHGMDNHGNEMDDNSRNREHVGGEGGEDRHRSGSSPQPGAEPGSTPHTNNDHEYDHERDN